MKKKSIALILGLFFVLSFAATAFAIQAEIPSETTAIVAAGSTNITLSGDLRVRGWFKDNLTQAGVPTKNANDAYYDERVRLAVDASSGPVSGRIHLESNLGSNDVSVWGNGSFDGKQSNGLGILEAWINYAGSGLLGVPSGIKVGHMPLALGPAPLFFDHRKFGDDAIVAYASPAPNVHLTALTIKAVDQSQATNSDNKDIDAYVAVANGEFAKQELGVDFTYVNDPSGAYLASGQSLSLQDLGLFGAGSISGIGYTAEADFQFGKLNDTVDASGYGLWLNLNYKLAPITIRALFAYGSGNDGSDATKNKQLINFLSSDRRYTLVYEYTLKTAAGAEHTGIANTQVYNVGIDYNPLAALKLSLDGYYLRANELTAAETALGQNKDLGTEVDFNATYQLTKNLTYFFNAGVLSEGDFYKKQAATADTTPTVIMHGLEMAF
ncbi:MAG: alginate export family protein [Nitrospiraceae bacterium]|nr:alginate export family protein [Nitrospiraceae bacterium]